MTGGPGVVRQPAPHLRTSSDVASDYRTRGGRFTAERDAAARAARGISNLRLIAFTGMVVSIGVGVTGAATLRVAGAIAGLVAFVSFLVLARAHERARDASRRGEGRRRECDYGAHRVERNWSGLPELAVAPNDDGHPYAADLDLFGRSSLARLLDVASAGVGWPVLTRWLMHQHADVEELRARQRAVSELAPEHEWRETLAAGARVATGARTADAEPLIAWAEAAPWITNHTLDVWLARFASVLVIVGVVLHANGTLRYGWVPPIALILTILRRNRAALQTLVRGATAHASALDAYAEMFRHVRLAQFDAERLRGLQSRLAAGRGADEELRALHAIARWAEVRYSPMAYAALQAVLGWDLIVAVRLEHWRDRAGGHMRDWLDALGETEALSALATLAHDHPAWTMPELVGDGRTTIDGIALGHPLLADAVRVPNDVSLGPEGRLLLVTGSNMSGKSTLLRSIGLNVILAGAGAPVCAASLRVPLVTLWTCMRIQDSLAEGLSLFMAELERLRRIVDAAREPKRVRPIVVLLDEMLHGTNSEERRVAARTVLGHLMHAGAISAVTTHDLALADEPSLRAATTYVHFSEQFDTTPDGERMTFDYRLRPGIATSANALRLLEMVGLGGETAGEIDTAG